MKTIEILETAKRENVRFIKLMFTDVLGQLKNVEITIHELERALKNGIMIDGSSIRGLTATNNSDVSIAPDPETFRILSFLSTDTYRVAGMMCDLLDANGNPSDGCVRTNLKRVLCGMEKAGFSTFNVGFEPEFYLLKSRPTGKVTPELFLDGGDYCADDNNDAAAAMRREIIIELEKLGMECSTSHHEVGKSQYEITYKFAPAVTTADNIMLMRFLVKYIAQKHGLFATFLPKPVQNAAGNGLHTNVSLAKLCENAFWDKQKNVFSDTAKAFISGVLDHAGALCFLTNPTTNSYLRLVKHYEAPVNVCYSLANRSAMIRVPVASGNRARAEVRSVDSSSNPYVALAAILTAGLEGIKSKKITAPTEQNIYKLTDAEKQKLGIAALPTSLEMSLAEFQRDETIKSAITEKIASELVKYKTAEIETAKRGDPFDVAESIYL